MISAVNVTCRIQEATRRGRLSLSILCFVFMQCWGKMLVHHNIYLLSTKLTQEGLLGIN